MRQDALLVGRGGSESWFSVCKCVAELGAAPMPGFESANVHRAAGSAAPDPCPGYSKLVGISIQGLIPQITNLGLTPLKAQRPLAFSEIEIFQLMEILGAGYHVENFKIINSRPAA